MSTDAPSKAEDDTPEDPVTMAIAALRCATAKGNDLIAVSSFAEVALAYLTGHGGDYTAYLEAQDEAKTTKGEP